MASKWINAILWTLVSVNLITLVLGGLVTWLGYAIPIRLRQFGLSPEITQMAGFASLLIACLGLGGLNYSSHYALNAYGLSCAIFIILMLFGVLPDNWQRAIYSPSHTAVPPDSSNQQQQHQQKQQQPDIDGTSATQRLKSGQPHRGGLILDLLYIVLLFVLSVLLALALILAQHLRRRELERGDEGEPVVDCCDQELGGSIRYASRGNAGNRPLATSRRRLLSTMQTDDVADWNCTCSVQEGGDSLNMAHTAANTGQVFAATMGAVTNTVATNKEEAGLQDDHGNGNEEDEDKIRFMQRMISDISNGPHNQLITANHDVNAINHDGNNDHAIQIAWRNSQSATPNRWGCRPTGVSHHSLRLTAMPARLDQDSGRPQLGANAHRLSSKSLANLANESIVVAVAEDGDGVIDSSGQETTGMADKFLAAPPLVHKGVYYASGHERITSETGNDLALLEQTQDDLATIDRLATENGAFAPGSGKHHSARQRKFDLNSDHTSQQQHPYRMRTPEGRCCCSDLPAMSCHSSKAAATLAAKLNPSAMNCSQTLLDDYYYHQNSNNYHHRHHHRCRRHQHQLARNGTDGRSVYNPNTMPSKLNLSSVYAIRPVATTTNPSSGPFEMAAMKQKQSKISSGSVMAMTASAAAALLGGVAFDPDAISHNHGGGLTSSLNLDDGADYADSFMDHQGDRSTFGVAAHLDCANASVSSNYTNTIDHQHN